MDTWHNVGVMPRPSQANARRSWWWVFALFIATPALALAFLGLDAIRADDIEQRQRLLDGQQQVLRLTDAAIGTALEREVAEARARLQDAASPGNAPQSSDSPMLFQRDRRGVLAFPEQRVFFGAADAVRLGFAAAPDPAVEVLVDMAGAAAAQGRGTEAAGLYARLRQVPALRAWADLQVLLLQPDGIAAVAATADAQLTTSDVRSPAGIPLAIVISSLCGEMRPAERLRFLPFVERTLQSLRAGTWWLTIEQRRAYDGELRQWLTGARLQDGAPHDERLERIAAAAAVIDEASAVPVPLATRVLDAGSGPSRLLIVRTHADDSSVSASGLAIPWERAGAMVQRAVGPLLNGPSIRATVVDSDGALWGNSAGTPRRTMQLDTVPGWALAFDDEPAQTNANRHRFLNYARVGFPIIVLACGVAMTAWIRRREQALGDLQATFIAAVTHEFKSPLTGIKLLLERITSGRAGSCEDHRYHQAIGAETTRLESLVNRLLEAQKLQRGQKEYAFEPASLQGLVGEVVQRMRPQIEARLMRLNVSLPADIPHARVDAESLSDAVRNLLDNALKYSPAGGVIDLGLVATESGIELSVSDQGVGVDADERDRIFDAFVRSRRGDAANVQGTGLGLALVKATVEAHGGRVVVAGNSPRGTRFTILLPSTIVLPGQAAAGAQTREQGSAPSRLPVDTRLGG